MSSLNLSIKYFLAASYLFGISASLFCQPEPLRMDSVTIPGSEVGFNLVLLPAGSFQMGKSTEEDRPTVELDAFWISVKEVTHDAFRLFESRENDTDAAAPEIKDYSADAITRPSPPYLDYTYGMGKRGGFPAVSMTQQSALRYCQWLYQKTGVFYRLPTEAEWEYACRAGSEGDYPPGMRAEDLGEYAWYYENSNEAYQKTGLKQPNNWGLYDLLGNVAEWTLDHYDKDYFTTIKDQLANPWIEPTRKHSRTVRGGSYDTFQKDCSCTDRQKSLAKWQARDPQIPKSIWWNPDSPFVGFRMVRPVEQPKAETVEAFFAKAIKD